METRIRALVIFLAMILAVGPPGARPAAASVEGSAADGLAGGGQTPVGPTATSNPSAVTWGSRQNVGANYTWSYGSHLATTSSATKTYLHDVALTDRVGGKWADNNGPYVGVMYVRGNASGTSWGTPRRLNSSSQHGDAAVIATSGKYVYVTWFRITKYQNYNPEAPRTLYFRRNTGHGAADSWKTRLALTSTTGRVGYPSIAASGAFVYVAYTDADTGSIRLATSTDRGATWTTSTIGTTTGSIEEGGYEGNPSIAASGSNVVVSWLTDDGDGGPSVVVRVSTDHGANFDTPTTLDTSSTHVSSSAARDSRIGVAWPSADGVRFRLWTAGTWSDVQTVGPPPGRAYDYHYSPAIGFGTAGQVGIAWSACWNHCDTFDELTRVDLAWAESKDGGATWYDGQVVGSGGGSTWRINDAPSVLWPTAGKRIVAWNGWRAYYASYRMFLRVGSGTN